MPTSSHKHISDVIEKTFSLNPKSFLDVGCGFGKWGFLVREYCDIYHGRYFPDSWQTRIDAIEAFASYISPHHKYIYNKIYLETVEEYIKKNKQKYDVILAGDVIEHMKKKDGLNMIGELLDRSKQALIVAIPLSREGEPHQGSVFKNSYERHRSHWSKLDLIKLNPNVVKSYSKDYAIAIWYKNSKKRSPFLTLIRNIILRFR